MTGTITMYDAVDTGNLPRDGEAYAGYVGGQWPTFATLQRLFPHAQLLSIAVEADEDAEALDIESLDATPEDAPPWTARQRARGVARPCLYASASTMGAVWSFLRTAGVARSSVRLWSAHYTGVPHICGPDTCAYPGCPPCDGTQWLSESYDTSMLLGDFFDASSKPAPPAEDNDMVINGVITGAKQDLVLPGGDGGAISTIRFGCSMDAKIAVDLRNGKAMVPLTLGDASTQTVDVPPGCRMVVVHVEQPAGDGTPVGYAGW